MIPSWHQASDWDQYCSGCLKCLCFGSVLHLAKGHIKSHLVTHGLQVAPIYLSQKETSALNIWPEAAPFPSLSFRENSILVGDRNLLGSLFLALLCYFSPHYEIQFSWLNFCVYLHRGETNKYTWYASHSIQFETYWYVAVHIHQKPRFSSCSPKWDFFFPVL